MGEIGELSLWVWFNTTFYIFCWYFLNLNGSKKALKLWKSYVPGPGIEPDLTMYKDFAWREINPKVMMSLDWLINSALPALNVCEISQVHGFYVAKLFKLPTSSSQNVWKMHKLICRELNIYQLICQIRPMGSI